LSIPPSSLCITTSIFQFWLCVSRLLILHSLNLFIAGLAHNTHDKPFPFLSRTQSPPIQSTPSAISLPLSFFILHDHVRLLSTRLVLLYNALHLTSSPSCLSSFAHFHTFAFHPLVYRLRSIALAPIPVCVASVLVFFFSLSVSCSVHCSRARVFLFMCLMSACLTGRSLL
jgi:hypothetical protein